MNHLFLGLGSIGKRHLHSCLRLNKKDGYYALRHSSRATPLESDFSSVKFLPSWQDAQSVSIDVVWVCSPTHVHADQVAEALFRFPQLQGLFLEKPVAHRTDDLKRIEKLLTQHKLVFAYGCILRHHPLIQRAAEWIREGKIGKPISYLFRCGSDLRSWRSGQDYRESYSARQDWGGGVHLDLIHEFDLAQFLFGSPIQMNGCLARLSSLEVTSADYCSAILKHPSGVMGVVQLDYFRQEPTRFFEVNGDLGSIRGDLIEGILEGPKGIRESYLVSRDQLHDRQTKVFLEAVQSGRGLADFREVIALNQQVLNLEDNL